MLDRIIIPIITSLPIFVCLMKMINEMGSILHDTTYSVCVHRKVEKEEHSAVAGMLYAYFSPPEKITTKVFGMHA